MNKFFFFLSITFFFLFFTCKKEKQPFTIDGLIFGTSYQIKYFNSTKDIQKSQKNLSTKIIKKLNHLNDIFSTYNYNSELSKVNSSSNLNTPIKISFELYEVLFLAKKIFYLSEGFFDVTIHPLIKLWGFEKKKAKIPKKQEIAEIKKNVDGGAYLLEKNNNSYWLIKKKQISIDLSSIAKGYAVDQIKELLLKENITNFLIEIGGEMFASGKKKKKKWRVGIIHPNKKKIAKIIAIQKQAMATSGDYENFFIKNNTRYSHVINPKTGYPIQTSLRSVTVIAKNCVMADALATALFSMGNKAFKFAKKNNISGFFIYEKKNKYSYFSTLKK